jgi:hypothetical protein
VASAAAGAFVGCADGALPRAGASATAAPAAMAAATAAAIKDLRFIVSSAPRFVMARKIRLYPREYQPGAAPR